MAIYVSGNIHIREMFFALAGVVVEGHAHNFDHTTYVIRGAVKIERLDADGNVVQIVTKKASDGQNWVLIKAGVLHRLTAMEDNSMGHCISSHRDPETGEVIADFNGWDEAYV